MIYFGFHQKVIIIKVIILFPNLIRFLQGHLLTSDEGNKEIRVSGKPYHKWNQNFRFFTEEHF